MSLRKKAITGVFWSALEQFGNQLVGFVVSIVLARLLLPSEFGLIAMLAVFMGIAQALIESGLTQSLIRDNSVKEIDFSTVFYFNLFTSLLIYLIIVLIAPFIAIFYNQPILEDIIKVYCLVFIINALGAIQKTRLIKLIDFKSQMLVSVPSLILSGAVGITLAYNDFGVWSLVWSKIAQSLTSTILFWFWANWKPSLMFSFEVFKKHFNFGYKLLFTALIDVLFVNSFAIIIGKYFSPAQVGYYNRAEGLQMRPVGIVNGIVNRISYPLMAQIQDDDLKLRGVCKRMMQIVTFLIAPTLVILAVLAEPLFRFVYTDKWLPAVPYLQILFINGILYPLHVFNLQILNVKGRSDLVLKAEFLKKAILIVSLIIGFNFGVFGLLFGSVFLSIVGFVINTYFSGRFINYYTLQQAKDLLPIILIAFLSGGGSYILDHLLSHYHDLVRIITAGTSGMLIFIVLSWLFKLEPIFELKSLLKKTN